MSWLEGFANVELEAMLVVYMFVDGYLSMFNRNNKGW